ncbi:hypothetical protein ABIE26_003987 [Pedobacter africanus]|uniref:Uncharacterized protein n=1 Tax=Pedobacter africanus TaxID=151894 RepID=A0ACC6L1N6_9SPHI|nr:hypothetical protein [Pedobacter africanus]
MALSDGEFSVNFFQNFLVLKSQRLSEQTFNPGTGFGSGSFELWLKCS